MGKNIHYNGHHDTKLLISMTVLQQILNCFGARRVKGKCIRHTLFQNILLFWGVLELSSFFTDRRTVSSVRVLFKETQRRMVGSISVFSLKAPRGSKNR